MSVPDPVVFDAEPLIAHADAEPGSQRVDAYLDAVVEESADGYTSCVTLAEVRYVLARKYDRSTADEYLGWLGDLGVEAVDTGELWETASEVVLEHNPALGDSFALATADHVDGTLLVGGDDDYDEVTDAPVERFRAGSA
jgi:predicted nucleic acid-binding protein